jgi:lysophospholipid acyltransferase (LPLAT)-like uncharacterized protein
VRFFSSKRLADKPWVQKSIGVTAAGYLRFVWKTTRFELDPPDIYKTISSELPVIITFWHGQHFLAPFIKEAVPDQRAKVLISRHRDGEINAIAAERLGIETIRGSGDHGGEFHRKGAVGAFREMLVALEEGYNIALTADVPKVSRVCGLGIVKLSSLSGRTIVPIAIATHRRIELDTWDHTSINLPFGRGARTVGTPIRVPRDADDAKLEIARRAVEISLNVATKRAYDLADAIRGGSASG